MHEGAATLFVIWVITSQWQCEFYCSCVCVHNNEIILVKILGGAPTPPAPPPLPMPLHVLDSRGIDIGQIAMCVTVADKERVLRVSMKPSFR